MKHVVGVQITLMVSHLISFWCHAVAPPHPDFQEAYLKDRRRLARQGSSSSSSRNQNQKRRLLDPQFCNGLTNKECHDWNESFRGHTRKLNEFVKRTGTLRPLVLLMKFSDHTDKPLPTREQVDELWNGIGITDNIPTGSIYEYMDVNSLGEFSLEADVMDWKTTDNTEQYYAEGQSGLTRNLALSMHPLLKELDAEGLDFSQYDRNNDRVIDVIVVLTSSFPAELGGKECFQDRSYTDRIWAHATSQYFQNFETNQGYQIGAYVFASALRGNCGGNLARLGVITHELFHTWGVPDLYDTSGDYIGKGVGTFDIMGSPYGLNVQGDHPNHMGPWTKIFSGWVTPTEITQDGLYRLNAAATSNQVYKISNFPSPDEYLLIENRQPIYWDELLWNGGILIWHIDEAADYNNNRGFPGQSGWPGNGNHYSVAIEQADRYYDLENGYNMGGESDFWINGTEYTYGPLDREAVDLEAYPNSNAYRFGDIQSTNIRIYDFSDSGDVMTFRVSGVSPPTAEPTKNPAAPKDGQPFFPSMMPSEEPVPTPRPSRRPTRSPKTIISIVDEPTASPSVLPAPGISFEPSGTRTKSPSGGLEEYDVDLSYFTNPPAVPETQEPVRPPTQAPVETDTFPPFVPVTDSPEDDSSGTLEPFAPLILAPYAPLTLAPFAPLTLAPLGSMTQTNPPEISGPGLFSPEPSSVSMKPVSGETKKPISESGTSVPTSKESSKKPPMIPPSGQSSPPDTETSTNLSAEGNAPLVPDGSGGSSARERKSHLLAMLLIAVGCAILY